MKFLCLFTLLSSIFSPTFSYIHHHHVEQSKVVDNSYQWDNVEINSFEELLVSWNSLRPEVGYYTIYVSVDTGVWSPWLRYADWGSDFQKSYISKGENLPVQIYQDTIGIIEGSKGRGFRIKVVAENGANLSNFRSLHVCSSNPSLLTHQDTYYSSASTFLNVEGISQMALDDIRNKRLCSPTSATAVVRFLKNTTTIDPIQFAESCWDSGFDIFGNWVFSAAEAYNQINNSEYSCWVEHHESFLGVLNSLEKGFPSVISVRGPLPGSALPYKSGHLLAVLGFDEANQEVICMDPAFLRNEETIVRYKLNDLLKAWGRRKNITYVFSKSS